MKVLWFTNTPSLATSALNSPIVSGGWISSLEKALQGSITLSVAFYHDRELEPFTVGTTTYYPIYTGRKGRIGKIVQRLFNRLEDASDVRRFKAIADRVQPDLIHVHGTEGAFGLIQQHTTIPVVLSIQGIVTVCARKYFSGISRREAFLYEPVKQRILLNSYMHQYKRFLRQAKREQVILQSAQYLIGRTDWDRRVTQVMTANARYYHVDEILRDAFYEQQWTPVKSGSPKFVTTTGPNLFKGLETLLLCSHLLDRQAVQYTWYIAGVSASDRLIRTALSALRIPLSANLVFLGTVDATTLAGHLLESQLYIGISHIENSPNSLCEAMLLGMPCISTFAGGTSALLENGTDGVLIQDGDPYAMAGAILESLAHPEMAETRGKSARKKALERHDPSAVQHDLLGAYREIITAANAVSTTNHPAI